VSRIGLGRHGNLDDAAGDPLDGLVNLFDVGIVLAVAFLIAGLGLTVDRDSRTIVREPLRAAPSTQTGPGTTQPLPAPSVERAATGRGERVGSVYRLPDGRLVLVEGGAP
jgi:hypothetical protein